MIHPQTKGKDISIMIWGAIWIGGRSNIVIMIRDEDALKRGYSARSYLQCLDAELSEPWFQEMIFMQDNAPIHKASIVQEWLRNYEINVMEWPPYSPDLSPIEHVWAMLKKMLLERYPDLADIGRNTEAIERFKRRNP
jgi:hypothetical protein